MTERERLEEKSERGTQAKEKEREGKGEGRERDNNKE